MRSAGSDPADQLNPAVIAAMAEWGIDLSRECPKPLTDEVVQAADAVITMGCGDACPIYPGKRYLDWELDDPAGRPVEQVRAIRDEIDRRVQALLPELVPTALRRPGSTMRPRPHLRHEKLTAAGVDAHRHLICPSHVGTL